jgi:hypothetical protein
MGHGATTAHIREPQSFTPNKLALQFQYDIQQTYVQSRPLVRGEAYQFLLQSETYASQYTQRVYMQVCFTQLRD